MISTKNSFQLFGNHKQEAYRTEIPAQSAPVGAAVSRIANSIVLVGKKRHID